MEKRLNGITFDEFVKALFEFEYCHECGGDAGDHDPAIVLGNWFAYCRRTIH